MHSPDLGNDAPTVLAPPSPCDSAAFAPRTSAWMRWWPAPVAAGAGRALEQARREFSASLADLTGPRAQALRRLVEGAGSLRELWHLRPEVFRHVALHHSQHVAQGRVAQLNHHFRALRRASGAMASRP